ncbi:DEKNAAC104817 [Brettanomyces naardenensis]|uniref:DEKNAAC104818 n=1 Tax=Brettanomyces naardenensis TaxID=13370 RepID=A0A448YRX9_BRENA|nr:DEKNAAC104817 [Brettanomyces naardenensis]
MAAKKKERPSNYIIQDQDRLLPIANVSRVIRKALPIHGKLSKQAAECIQECVSEFISFITSEAAEKCSIEQRKTLNGEDILHAMYSLGFDNYAETLKIYLAKYREYEVEESEARRRKYLQRKEKIKLERLAKEGEENTDEPGGASGADEYIEEEQSDYAASSESDLLDPSDIVLL